MPCYYSVEIHSAASEMPNNHMCICYPSVIVYLPLHSIKKVLNKDVTRCCYAQQLFNVARIKWPLMQNMQKATKRGPFLCLMFCELESMTMQLSVSSPLLHKWDGGDIQDTELRRTRFLRRGSKGYGDKSVDGKNLPCERS